MIERLKIEKQVFVISHKMSKSSFLFYPNYAISLLLYFLVGSSIWLGRKASGSESPCSHKKWFSTIQTVCRQVGLEKRKTERKTMWPIKMVSISKQCLKMVKVNDGTLTFFRIHTTTTTNTRVSTLTPT